MRKHYTQPFVRAIPLVLDRGFLTASQSSFRELKEVKYNCPYTGRHCRPYSIGLNLYRKEIMKLAEGKENQIFYESGGNCTDIRCPIYRRHLYFERQKQQGNGK